MMSYNVLMTLTATNDLKGIADYISYDLREPSIANKTVGKIREAVMSLVEFPARHPLVADDELAVQGIRRLQVDNYLIFYVIDEKDRTVTIVRILYVRRDWIHLL